MLFRLETSIIVQATSTDEAYDLLIKNINKFIEKTVCINISCDYNTLTNLIICPYDEKNCDECTRLKIAKEGKEEQQ